jgi:hypothetical protein
MATLYNTLIRPVLLYVSETWCLTKKRNRYMHLRGKVLRKIFGPVKDGEVRRI